MRRLNKPCKFALMLPLIAATLFVGGDNPAYASGNTYYADHISTCVDPCGGLSERGCGCVKLPPIIVHPE